MVHKNIDDDILIKGSCDSSISKIKKPVEKTLGLEGNVDILSVGTGINDAKLSVGGVEIKEYLNYVFDQEYSLSELEKQKKEFKNIFFDDNHTFEKTTVN